MSGPGAAGRAPFLGCPAQLTPSPQARYHGSDQPGGGLARLICKVGHIVAMTPVSWAVTGSKRVRRVSFRQ